MHISVPLILQVKPRDVRPSNGAPLVFDFVNTDIARTGNEFNFGSSRNCNSRPT